MMKKIRNLHPLEILHKACFRGMTWFSTCSTVIKLSIVENGNLSISDFIIPRKHWHWCRCINKSVPIFKVCELSIWISHVRVFYINCNIKPSFPCKNSSTSVFDTDIGKSLMIIFFSNIRICCLSTPSPPRS